MARYVKISSTETSRIVFSSGINRFDTVWEYETKFTNFSNSNDLFRLITKGNETSITSIKWVSGNTYINMGLDEVNRTFTWSGLEVKSSVVGAILRVTNDGTTMRAYINGVEADNTSSPANFRYLDWYGTNSRLNLYYARYWNDLTRTNLVHDWDSETTNGTGSLLVDSAGTNNGTLFGTPTWGDDGISSNVGPTASAGTDQTGVTQGATVTLDASGSTDDVGIASYSWVQTAGTTVTLSDATAAQPTFTAPAVAEMLTFEVTVTDAGGLTSTDTVNVGTAGLPNQAPVANAGADQIDVVAGATVTLDGSGSSDSDGTITHSWAQTAGTDSVTLGDATAAITTFLAPAAAYDQVLGFTLSVTDNDGAATTNTVNISIKAEYTAPIAVAAADGTAIEQGAVVTLNSTGSSGEGLTYEWKQISGVYAELNERYVASPNFTVPKLTNETAYAQDIYVAHTQSTTNMWLPLGLSKILNFNYLGAFRPYSSASYGTEYNMGAVGLSEDGTKIYVATHDYNNGILQFPVPSTFSLSSNYGSIPTVAPLQPYVSVNNISTVGGDNDRVNGVLEHNGSLLITSEVYYDTGDTSANLNVVTSADDFSLGGKGKLKLAGASHSGGWMGHIPTDKQALLGGAFLSGWAANYSITSRYSQGPSLFVFDAQDAIDVDMAGDINVPATALLDYSWSSPLVQGGDLFLKYSRPLWNSGSKARGGFIIPGTDYYLVLGKNRGVMDGMGYKITQDTGNVCGGPCPYVVADEFGYYWIYKLSDIAAAPSSSAPKPFSHGRFSLPLDNYGKSSIKGATYDYNTNRLFINTLSAGDNTSDQPLIQVFEITPTGADLSTVGTDASDMVFELTVTDGVGTEVVDTVTLSYGPAAPVAQAGVNQLVALSSLVTLDGTGSSDANGDAITYLWSLLSKPAGSTAVLSDTTASQPTFTADLNGAYVAQLVVNDGVLDSTANTVTISVNVNAVPDAHAGTNQSVTTESIITLDGSGSSDADGDVLTYLWTLSTVPIGSSATLSSATSVSPTFTADFNGVYVAQLVVNDGTVDSTVASVTVTSTTPSKLLNITASGIPSGTYRTVITAPADNSVVYAGDLTYAQGEASIATPTAEVGTQVTGYVIDNEAVHLNGMVITGTIE